MIGWIHRRDRCGPKSLGELGGESTRARTDVQHSPLIHDAGKVSKAVGEGNGVPAHEAVVGLRRNSKSHVAEFTYLGLAEILPGISLDFDVVMPGRRLDVGEGLFTLGVGGILDLIETR